MIRPLRGLYTLLLTLFQIVSSGFRVFALDGLRAGVVDVRPLSRAVRLLVVAALALVILFLLSLLFGDTLRAGMPLQTLRLGGTGVRALTVPVITTPLTLIAIILAWSYILTAALYIRAGLRWLTFVVYILFGLLAFTNGMNNFAGLGVANVVAAVAPTLGVLLAFGLMVIALLFLPRLRVSYALGFFIMLSLNLLMLLPSLWSTAYVSLTVPDAPFHMADMLNETLMVTRALLVPFLLISGAEMANFALTASGWATQAAERHTTRGLAVALLFLLLVLRLANLISDLGFSAPNAFQWNAFPWPSWAGALILLMGLAVIGMCLRKPLATMLDAEEVPFGTIVWLSIAFALLQILLVASGRLIVYVVLGLVLVTNDFAQATALSNDIFGWVSIISATYGRYSVLIQAGLGLLIAAFHLWPGKGASQTSSRASSRWLLVAFGLVLAWGQAWRWVTQREQPLAGLHFEYAHVDHLLIIGLLIASIVLVARGQLTRDRALRLLGVAVLAALLNQTSFLDNPFSPVFGAAAMVLLVIGIVWNVLTAGGRFLNADSAAFPRPSRALMYFGYVMLSVVVANWFFASHAVEQQTQQGDLSLSGFNIFGLTLAYVVLVRLGRPLLPD